LIEAAADITVLYLNIPDPGRVDERTVIDAQGRIDENEVGHCLPPKKPRSLSE
jgi:hypothetical protein